MISILSPAQRSLLDHDPQSRLIILTPSRSTRSSSNGVLISDHRRECKQACDNSAMPNADARDESVVTACVPEAVRRLPISGLRTALLLFLFLNCVYLLTSTGRARSIDEIDPVMQAESILLRHSTAIPQAVHSGIYFGKFDRHGTPRSAWPFGHAILVLPWSAFGHSVLIRIPGIAPGVADLVFTTATCWSNATYAALAVASSFLTFFKVAGRSKPALLCSLLLAFSTPLFVYSGWLFSEPLTAALLAVAALLLFGTGIQPSAGATLAGAGVLAFSIHVRPANMITVLVFIAASLWLREGERAFSRRTAAVLVCMVGISGLLYLLRNYRFFGNPFDFGVPATAENGKDLESWHNPFWRGAFGFLFSPGKSIFLFCPPAVLGILGLRRLWGQNRALAVLAGGAPMANLALYSFRTQWEGSYCYGPRYLIPSLVLLCFPIATLFREPPSWFRPLFWGTAIAGVLVQAIGLSTNILEDMVRNGYYDAHWDYRMSYSPISGQLRLIWKYMHSSPTALGLGWDRWFVLLRAAGVSPSVIAVTVLLFLAGALSFGAVLWRASHNWCR
jgi:hypothetical protein